MSPRGPAPEILARARAYTQPALQDAVRRLHPLLVRPVEYHLGWVDELGEPIPDGGGKGIRPALAVLSTEAAGALASVGVPGAVAIELVHNFSLLHDDVIDRDVERRHRATVWALFGVGDAIIAGDALVVLAIQVLLQSRTSAAARAAVSVTTATERMIAGQALDMAFEQRCDVSIDEALEMTAGKTGALLSCAASIGAVLADADPPVVDALADYGHHLGLAFQAVDDLLGIWGDPAVTGKPVGSDLRQRKKSIPVVYTLAKGNGRADELRALFEQGELDERAVTRAMRAIERAGARELTQMMADTHLDAALTALDRVSLVPRAHEELIELARFVVAREF